MINSKSELAEWLTAVHIDIQQWGKNGSKNVCDLWQEIQEGETQLQIDPPQRNVQVAEMIIRQGDHILMEAAQEMADGQIRKRNIPPSEKMKAGESLETAVIRGLNEELGTPPQNITVHHNTYQKKQHTKPSPSYPGLPTHYTIHIIDVTITDLPQTDFWHDNASHINGDDPIKRHHWAWQQPQSHK